MKTSRSFGFLVLFFSLFAKIHAQTNPIITHWLFNLDGTKGRRYVSGNSTPIQGQDSSNVLRDYYSANWVYVRTNGVPGYITGPFLDGNPSITTSQNAIFKFPLNPVPNTGTPTPVTMGNIGVFVNGVALFDSRDGVSWKNSTQALAGGPLGGMGDNVWNRDAIKAERVGFDCAKGHPAMGNYHHHQNPSAFDLDMNVLSTICNLYDADGLYAMDSTQHSPLLGFAYDGYPIYGAYAYANANGTGGIVRIKSGYQLRNITTRTTNASGATVTAGPPVSTTYPLGYFKEDYEFISHPGQEDYLDVHNGRFCVTPEYPNGTYCYFATVDASWNSTYPYLIGPTYYGVKTAAKVTSITEAVTLYNPNLTGVGEDTGKEMMLKVFPNPGNEFLAVQLSGLNRENVQLELFDATGRVVVRSNIAPGSTLTYLDISSAYAGTYVLRCSTANRTLSKKVVIK